MPRHWFAAAVRFISSIRPEAIWVDAAGPFIDSPVRLPKFNQMQTCTSDRDWSPSSMAASPALVAVSAAAAGCGLVICAAGRPWLGLGIFLAAYVALVILLFVRQLSADYIDPDGIIIFYGDTTSEVDEEQDAQLQAMLMSITFT
jgi:hypothetical protein